MKKLSILVALLTVLGPIVGRRSVADEADSVASEPPNVVIILTDDLGYGDLACYGAKKIKTPNLDEMAAQGVRFTSYYAASPWCSSSRAALLTGCYPERNSVPGGIWAHTRTGLHPDEITIAEILQQAGYATALFGKWHLGTEPEFLPTRQGFEVFFGTAWSHGGYTPVYRDERVVGVNLNHCAMTRDFNNHAIRFIREHRDRPFFVLLSHPMPHHPLDCSTDFHGKSAGGMYGDVIEELDWSVGELLAAIEDEQLEKRTLVIFTSDNGPWTGIREGYVGGLTGPLRERKGSVYEGGSRVPFIARWNGTIPPGATCDSVATALDLLPTLARMAGADAPTDRVVDGQDIWPLLNGTAAKITGSKPHFYFGSQAVRDGKWKLLDGRNELYDLHADIGEANNVIADFPEVAERLRKLIQEHRQDLSENRRPLGVAR